jgi:hypothetical protein
MAGIDTKNSKDSHVAGVAETLGNLSFLEYQRILARKTEFVECLELILSSENKLSKSLLFLKESEPVE